jgi:tetratricopeptide (TPR) repeat protein
MALRLTPGPAPTAKPLVERLAPIADELLRRHDLSGWVKLYDGITDEQDPHRRYEARRMLASLAVNHNAGSTAQTAARLLVVAGRLVRVLEEESREPVLLNEAGVAFYELGALDAAQALFVAAQRLDPSLADVARNIREIRRRRRSGVTRMPLPQDVAHGLRSLSPRAEAIARAARPAQDQTVSLCMIVKDEEAMLPRCLDAVRDWVDEMIVVDTGSTDRTVEIAQERGARVLHHEWQNDFSAARNVSFDAATCDWILYLDADEVLVDGDGPRLRELLTHTWREAIFLIETNHTGDLEDGTATTHDAMRLVRRRPDRRFTGRLHEQLQDIPAYLPERREISTVRIEHFGYLGEVREQKNKGTRNREILDRQFEDGDVSPFVRFNRGMEHVAAGEHHAAIEHLEQSWTELADDPQKASYGFTPMLASHLVEALRTVGRLDDAERRAEEVLAFYPTFTDIVLLQAHVAHLRGDEERAEERYRTCLQMGDAPSTLVAARGAGTFLPARGLADLLATKGRTAEAEELLTDALRRWPEHLRTAESLAALLRKRGLSGAETLARIGELVPTLPPSGRYLVAGALHRSGATEEAEAELRAVLRARPGSDAARVLLVETLLLQDRLGDALVEAALVAPGANREPAALRHAAFAGIAAGLPVDDVLARAADVLPPAEHALFCAWAGRQVSLAPSAADMALTMLNALARLERFEAFEALAAVFERIGLPWRERREQLARLYVRRGFLQSAADEWMAVVERSGPDADALRGLAIVAAEMGLEEDAAIFAADAEALDGAVAGAAR